MILDILVNYLVPIIYNSFVSLVFSLLIIHLFRIKDSNIRILFFFLPLVKPFLIIIERINFNKDFFNYRIGVLGLRFPSPNIIAKSTELIKKSPILVSNFDYLILLIVIFSVFLIIFLRLISLYFFYRSLAFRERIESKEAPNLFKKITYFSDKIRSKKPKISLTTKEIYSPFVIGIFYSTIVISPSLIINISSDELDTIIAHEICHLKRKDNIITWLALVFRDLLFFNPFAYISYYLIKLEQEKASDKLILVKTNITKKKLAKNILNILIKIKELNKNKVINTLGVENSFFRGYLTNISLKVRIRSIINSNIEKVNMKLINKIAFIIIFIALLIIQLLVIVKIDDFYIFLR